MKVGCAQGSTLGPRLFSIYCGKLREIIPQESFVVAYADDTYVLIADKDIEVIRSRAQEAMYSHVDWLKSIGMVVNVNKTESVLFSSPTEPPFEFVVNGATVATTPSMPVLGIEFNERMAWSKQVDNIIRTGQRPSRMMKHPRLSVNSLIKKLWISVVISKIVIDT